MNGFPGVRNWSPGRGFSPGRYTLACLGLLCLVSCTRGCTSSRPPIHLNPNMDNQPKYLPQSASRFFLDGATGQAPVEGTVARGELLEPSFSSGLAPDGAYIETPVELSPEILARGQMLYGIYCRPCHAENGDGQSMLRQRSGVNTANLLEERIREMPDGQLFDVISNGYGLMSGYRYAIQSEDRWAIAAHVRELQRSE